MSNLVHKFSILIYFLSNLGPLLLKCKVLMHLFHGAIQLFLNYEYRTRAIRTRS